MKLKLQKLFDKNLRTKYLVTLCFWTGLSNVLADLWPLSCLFLQRQVAGEVQTQPQDRAVNQIAMMLAIMGLSLSYYSAKQMTEKTQPMPWRYLTTPIAEKYGWANDKWRSWNEEAEMEAVYSGLHFSHLIVIITLLQCISGTDPHPPCAEISGLLLSVFYIFCHQDLEDLWGWVSSGG